MRVFRTQWPVGQGCFSSGIIDAEGEAPIHYVYDCGARNIKHLKPIASRYADGVTKLDALFVSHLDGDHVDGLDTLLATLEPAKVYLPYLDIVDRIAAVMEADDEGRLTASFLQAQMDPAGWFGDRGARTVIFVRNDGDGPEGGFSLPAEGGDPHRPDGRKQPLCLRDVGAIGVADRGVSSTGRRPQVLEMQVGASVHAERYGHVEWILVPFVPAVDAGRLANFRDAIRAALGLAASDPITAAKVLEKLKDKDGRADLRDCYQEILAGGAGANHNKISMSLYSGPARSNHDFTRRTSFFWDRPHFWHGTAETRLPGWIGTGDAKLKSRRRRTEWASFYRSLVPMVGTFVLPHHGSQANWHRALLDVIDANLFVAAADEPDEGYEHPSAAVMLDISEAKRGLAIVTKRPRTRLTEVVSS